MKMNRRKKTIIFAAVIGGILIAIAIAGAVMDPALYAPDYAAKKLAPSALHLFGTDYLGRDMFARTIKGLSNSILLGAVASTVSAFVALFLGILAARMGGVVDQVISYFVDMFMGIPHLVLLMLISFACGRGLQGVIIGVALTHWPNLTRVIRAEVLQIRNAQYVQVSEKFGRTGFQIAKEHILPHVVPQFLVGLVLLFPHAILHEAGITFLGFGLNVDMPAIGIILSEALKHISTGMWWLVVFPGVLLIAVVMLFDKMGDFIKNLIDPSSAQE